MLKIVGRGPVVLGVVPARGGSKGLPGKNIRPLAGRPLIEHTFRAARNSRRLTDFIVSTDDRAIARVCRRAGAPTPFIRPKALATDRISIWPAVRHAVAFWEHRHRREVDVVVLLQPTSPLRKGEDIDACVQRLAATRADLCLSVVRCHDSPYVNMVTERGTFARALTPQMKRHVRRQDAPPVFAVNGAVYALRRTVLHRLNNQFHLKKLAIYEMPRARSLDVDTAEDLALAEFWRNRS